MKSLSNIWDDHAYSKPYYSQNNLFNHLQGNLDICSDTDVYLAIFRVTVVQLGGRGATPPAVFENRKKCPDFWKKGLDCVYTWVKFSIQNVVLRVSRRKNSKMFPCGASFSIVIDQIFIEVP